VAGIKIFLQLCKQLQYLAGKLVHKRRVHWANKPLKFKRSKKKYFFPSQFGFTRSSCKSATSWPPFSCKSFGLDRYCLLLYFLPPRAGTILGQKMKTSFSLFTSPVLEKCFWFWHLIGTLSTFQFLWSCNILHSVKTYIMIAWTFTHVHMCT
jgi:hypothetical protein